VEADRFPEVFLRFFRRFHRRRRSVTTVHYESSSACV
jgi:hypothetical protein